MQTKVTSYLYKTSQLLQLVTTQQRPHKFPRQRIFAHFTDTIQGVPLLKYARYFPKTHLLTCEKPNMIDKHSLPRDIVCKVLNYCQYSHNSYHVLDVNNRIPYNNSELLLSVTEQIVLHRCWCRRQCRFGNNQQQHLKMMKEIALFRIISQSVVFFQISIYTLYIGILHLQIFDTQAASLL